MSVKWQPCGYKFRVQIGQQTRSVRQEPCRLCPGIKPRYRQHGAVSSKPGPSAMEMDSCDALARTCTSLCAFARTHTHPHRRTHKYTHTRIRMRNHTHPLTCRHICTRVHAHSRRHPLHKQMEKVAVPWQGRGQGPRPGSGPG